MYTLFLKELRSSFNSVSGILFSVIFLIVCGFLLWFIPGDYNIAESGYASLSSFFELAPVLLLVLIPALAMRAFSEEKKQGTLELLLTRPVRSFDIVFSKYLSVWVVVLTVLLPTIIYTFFLSYFALPQGNIDWGAIAGSYLGLLFLVTAFVAVSIFASSLTSNQVAAFITGLLICSVFYYGIELFSSLLLSGKANHIMRNIGYLSHYQSLQKGIIDTYDIGYFVIISCLFLIFTLQTLRFSFKRLIISILLLAILLILSSFFKFSLDLTSDKRYTLSETVKTLLKETKTPVSVECYLAGDLNPGFYQLQKSCLDMLHDFSGLTSGRISYQVINPYQTGDKEYVKMLSEKGVKGISVNERNREGKMVQQIVFPYLLFKSGENEVPVALLANEPGRSGQENLNTSIEMLEYCLANALETVTRKEARKIVFLQGHGELTPNQMSDLFDALSFSYQVDLGALPKNPEAGSLDEYELVVVPGPQEPFTEAEKYVLDQYIMHGGKVIWFINGVKLDLQALSEAGATPSMVNEVNLEDLLFGYGVRIEPVLLEDVQCLEIPLNTNPGDEEDAYTVASWYFAPVLNVASDFPANKGVSLVKTAFASTVSLLGKESRKHTLLYSSNLSATVKVPEMISLHEVNRIPDNKHFNQQHLPVAVLIEGGFTSGYKNRSAPQDVIHDNQQFKDSIGNNKMIVVASEDIIRNEITESESGIKIWPLGYDRYSEIQFGNREFMLNIINYLTDNSGISPLRNKHLQLRLLDKMKLSENQEVYVWMNLLLPPLLLLFLFAVNYLLRKRKYGKS